MHVFARTATPLLGMATLATLGLVAQPASAGTTLSGTYADSGAGYNYTNASSFLVDTTNDLIFGALPTDTNYNGNSEASGGSAVPFTDGTTSVDVTNTSEPTSAQNALLQIGNSWHTTYSLGTNASGYDLSSIVVTTGHQDLRVNQTYDILISTLANPTLTSLTGGVGYSYHPSTNNGGAAQTTVTEFGGGLLASGATQIEFLNTDGGFGAYRELGVYGTASTPSAAPEPSQMAGMGFTVLGLGGLLLRARKRKAGASAS
jgi:hypothetical protein